MADFAARFRHFGLFSTCLAAGFYFWPSGRISEFLAFSGRIQGFSRISGLFWPFLALPQLAWRGNFGLFCSLRPDFLNLAAAVGKHLATLSYQRGDDDLELTLDLLD